MGGMIRLDHRRRAATTHEFVAAETQGLDGAAARRRPVRPGDGGPAGRHPRRRLRGGGAPVRDRGPGRRGGGHGPGHVVGARHAARVPDPRPQRALRALPPRGRAGVEPGHAGRSRCRASRRRSGPFPSYGFEPKLRVRGLGDTLVGPSTAAIADEILEPGEGQIRALISCGGNPLAAWPDQLQRARGAGVGRAAGAVRPVDVVDREARRLRDRADAVARGPGHDQLRRHAPGVRAGIRAAEAVGAVHRGGRRRRRRAAT